MSFSLPPIQSAQDAATAAQAILSAVTGSDITPLEGTSVMGLVESYRKTLETTELEKRIEALEARK